MRMKKALSTILALALVISATSFSAMAEDTLTYDTWDGTTVTSPTLSGDTYIIDSASDLVGFSDMVNSGTTFSNKTVELTVNVDLGGYDFFPIGGYAYEGSTSKAFAGTFDGGNNIIANAVISDATNMGIFGFVQGGTVENLVIDSVTVVNSDTEDEAASGVAIGSIYQGTVTNIVVTNTCSVTGVNRVGGVIGSVRDEATIDGCTNEATVTSTGMYSGGVIGAAHDIDTSIFGLTGAPATIENCVNYGTVQGTTEVGGIVGYTDQTTVKNCTNSGTVTATGNYGTGGIVGFDAYNPRYFYKPTTGATVTSCDNTGSINGGRAGGIVGTLGVTPSQSQPSSDTVLTKITDCTNSGTITGTEGKIGGIFGYQITYASGDADSNINHLIVQITNCETSGETTIISGSSFVTID